LKQSDLRIIHVLIESITFIGAEAKPVYAGRVKTIGVGRGICRDIHGTLRLCRPKLWDLCNAADLFFRGHSAGPIFCSRVTKRQQGALS
jgi:hypothetical protein